MTLVLIFGGYAIAFTWGLILMRRWNASSRDWAGFYFALLFSVLAPLIGWLVFLTMKTFASGSIAIPVVCTLISIIFVTKAFAIRPSSANAAQVSIYLAGSIIASALALGELFLWANYGFMGANA